MPEYEELIKQSQNNVKLLSEKLKDLDTLHRDIKTFKEAAEGVPEIFNKKFHELAKLSEEYTNTLGAATKSYLDGNNTLFTTRLNELSSKIKEFEKETTRLINTDFAELFNELQKVFIDQTRQDLATELKQFEEYTNTLGAEAKSYLEGNNALFTTKLSELSSKIKEFEKETTRLVNTDFTELFNGLQKVFIDQTRRDLATELMRFEEKSKDLQTKIDELKRQIERLEQIDIEKHFDKFQKNISEIFGAINSINVTLTSTTQNLNSIVQSLGAIQTAIDTSQKEIKQVINSLREATLTHLTDQDLELKKNSELLESKIKLLMAQNQMLKKEIGGNRIIQFLGFGIIIIVLVYLILTIHS